MLGVYRPGSLLPGALPALRSTATASTFALGSHRGRARSCARRADRRHRSRRRQVREPQRAAGARRPSGDPTGRSWSTTTWRCPHAFLDRFLGVCEAFALDLAQPAQTLRSHSAWKVTRRRPAALARSTRFVEIGPVTAFRREPAAELLPFPELRFGWGLDLHWAALAAERGWRLGVVDAVPVRHEARTVAAGYPRREAEEEAARFLSERPYLPSARAGDTLAVHRRRPG